MACSWSSWISSISARSYSRPASCPWWSSRWPLHRRSHAWHPQLTASALRWPHARTRRLKLHARSLDGVAGPAAPRRATTSTTCARCELGWWEERGCNAAFIQLEGQQGITETRVSEVPARGVLPPVRLAFDEVVYVAQGRGATTVWRSGGAAQELRVAREQHVPAAAPSLPPVQQHVGHAAGAPAALQLLPAAAVGEPRTRRLHPDRHEARRPSRAREVDLEALYGEPTAAQDGRRGRDLEAPSAGLGGQLLPGHERLGQAERQSEPRRGRSQRGHGVPRLRDQLPHVDVPVAHLQEGASARPGARDRHPGRRGLLDHVGRGRRRRSSRRGSRAA